MPVSKLTRSTSNHFLQEKPVFPSSITDPKLCVPLELSDADGDRVPYTINRYLRDYQREGVSFIYNNYICSRGCILGDDMGLGKTVQVESQSPAKLFLSYLKCLRHFLLTIILAIFVTFLGHRFSCCCAEQNRHMGGHTEKQTSISAESNVL